MFKILGAKNRRKNLHKHPGPTFQIRPGPGYFSRADINVVRSCENFAQFKELKDKQVATI